MAFAPDADYAELSIADQVQMHHAMIQNNEQQLLQTRANRAIQQRLINSPLPESAKNRAKQGLKQFEAQIAELLIARDVLTEALAELEAQVPAKDEDGDADE